MPNYTINKQELYRSSSDKLPINASIEIKKLNNFVKMDNDVKGEEAKIQEKLIVAS